jgi:sugar phosphate isomerase/epimerase
MIGVASEIGSRMRARTRCGGRVMWGYEGSWPGDFNGWGHDETMSRLRFLAEQGFECGSVKLSEMRWLERREQIARFVADHDLHLTVRARLKWLEAGDEALRLQTQHFLSDLRRFGPMLRTPLVTTDAGGVQVGESTMSWEERLERLAEVLAPIALGCNDLGISFGIENRGGYRCVDLVRLCRETPHLGIFLDVGDGYQAGEEHQVYAEAASCAVGARFRDQAIVPQMEGSDVALELENRPLGEGDMSLPRVYRTLLDRAPGDLALLWEMEPPAGMGAYECLERSWVFVRGLPTA